jgi:hypothetical protein
MGRVALTKTDDEPGGVGHVWPLHPNLLIESLYPKNDFEDKIGWLTPQQAVEFGLSPGSRLYRQAIGELIRGNSITSP